MEFFLGTHRPQWLSSKSFMGVPLFVSRRTLSPMRTLPRALMKWSLDSGGFTELSLYGEWRVSPKQYVEEVRRISFEVGKLYWAAPQDWMCEPVITKKTKLSVEKHQRLTVDNYLELRGLAPELPFIPVLQGWSLADYWRCEELYYKAGVDLKTERIVGVGTVCRRQGTAEAERIMRTLASGGLKLHGFGFKTKGLERSADAMASSDSLAWSLAARFDDPIEGHDRPGPGRPLGHEKCANCPVYALRWRRRLLGELKKGGHDVR